MTKPFQFSGRLLCPDCGSDHMLERWDGHGHEAKIGWISCFDCGRDMNEELRELEKKQNE